MSFADADHFGVKDGDRMSLVIKGSLQHGVPATCSCGRDAASKLEVHIDTDEGNAADLDHADKRGAGETDLKDLRTWRRSVRPSGRGHDRDKTRPSNRRRAGAVGGDGPGSRLVGRLKQEQGNRWRRTSKPSA
jgi:hypothetical protein